jgi:hypothetical protein
MLRQTTQEMTMKTRLMGARAIAMIALAATTTLAAAAQSTFPSAAQEFPAIFWTERMMLAMDKNKDGMVSREEFVTYMGEQYDMMDTGKKGMLTKQQFMDKKMMSRTFPTSVSETGPR